ncbi:MAG: alpha/beta hydrolase [Thermoanaerobaculia bacterium]|nr:alpha/beta hydrolase [Thermoanaerobaculia bacterium]
MEEAAGDQEPGEPGPLARIAAAARASLTEAGLERLEGEIAGRRMVLWRGGSGPDLVLLHGSGQQAGSWAAVVPGLVQDHTLHVLDLPGHGESAPEKGILPMDTVVEGVETYLLGLENEAVLVGNSMGAWLATILAHRHPDRVQRIVIVNGGALLNVPAEGLTLMPANREQARKVMEALRAPESPPLSDELLDDIVLRSRNGPIGRMMQDMQGLMAHLLDGRLHEVEIPVDILWGESDRLIPLDYARRMESQLPRARLTVLERCGHIPASECPERFGAALREILERPPPDRSKSEGGEAEQRRRGEAESTDSVGEPGNPEGEEPPEEATDETADEEESVDREEGPDGGTRAPEEIP